mgnify:CR=1 FL=1
MKTKILFLIHDLGQGGAEKVLVNLVNNMDSSRFDISVVAILGGGANEQFLNPNIKFRAILPKSFPGNSKFMKLLSPQLLHKMCVKEHYDVEVSYLEGPSARIISGCPNKNTKLVSWIHVEQHTPEKLSEAFRSFKEAEECYKRFDQTVCVSDFVKKDFTNLVNMSNPCNVLYNTVESDRIIAQSKDTVEEFNNDSTIKLIAVGTLKKSKGYLRLLKIVKKLKRDNYPIHLYILGIGPQQSELEKYNSDNGLSETVTLLGYQLNPYKYVANADLFVCASYAEGFSTAATEALIVGTPVCTVNVSGMKEMLGENNEFGIVTSNNSAKELYQAIKGLLDNPEKLAFYKKQAIARGKLFKTEETVSAVEKMFLGLIDTQKIEIDYSVIIRTTGKAGKKYQRLLESIDKQRIAPKEVIVVLPEGYNEPKEKLGYEHFYYSPKGMVIQRLIGIDLCKTPYALICDDDVAFGADFVEKLYHPIKIGKGSLSVGPLYSFLPPKGLNSFVNIIMGGATPTIFHKDRYNSVLKTTGYSYNRHLDTNKVKYYETQSAAWTCFFVDIEELRSIHFEDEIWLDAHGYSAFDDQAMFYKAWLNNKKTIVVSNAFYEHLDAKTSTRNNRPDVTYSQMFNMVVFWHRFLYLTENTVVGKIVDIGAFAYRLMWIKIWDIFSIIRKRQTKEDIMITKKAFKDAKKYIKSEDYKNLPPLVQEKNL